MSSSSSTTGNITTIGFDVSANANAAMTNAKPRRVGRRTYSVHAQSPIIQKRPLKTSFRSVIQATDSTRSGCRANSAATAQLLAGAPVVRESQRNSSSAAAVCSSRFVT